MRYIQTRIFARPGNPARQKRQGSFLEALAALPEQHIHYGHYLSASEFDEVNFWQPSATPPFKGAPTGMPFLFKLKKPNTHIAGGGFFITYSTLPIALAWEIFREKNGAASIDDLRAMLRIASSRRFPSTF